MTTQAVEGAERVIEPFTADFTAVQRSKRVRGCHTTVPVLDLRRLDSLSVGDSNLTIIL
jgi:hypothetical protein